MHLNVSCFKVWPTPHPPAEALIDPSSSCWSSDRPLTVWTQNLKEAALLISFLVRGYECVFLLLHIWGKQLCNHVGSGWKFLDARVIVRTGWSRFLTAALNKPPLFILFKMHEKAELVLNEVSSDRAERRRLTQHSRNSIDLIRERERSVINQFR